jgi:hypothetical protein
MPFLLRVRRILSIWNSVPGVIETLLARNCKTALQWDGLAGPLIDRQAVVYTE